MNASVYKDRENIRLTGPIPEERYRDVIEHLRCSFFSDEPLNRSVQLCTRGQPHQELEEHSLLTLRDNVSQMALDISTNEIVGVALNGISHPGELAEAQVKLADIGDEKFRRIFGLLYGVNQQLDLFSTFGVERIFECRILSVDHRYRGLGIAKLLLERSEKAAKDAGFKLLKEDATGFYSQRVAESLGFKTIHEVPYVDYRDQDGHILFPTEEPHRSLKIMVKPLY